MGIKGVSLLVISCFDELAKSWCHFKGVAWLLTACGEKYIKRLYIKIKRQH